MASDLFFVTVNRAMLAMRAEIDKVARVDAPVLCLGESGTGKEVVARLIHNLSPRRTRRFLNVNCAALPGELLESELFGYEPGAFTGATHSKPGKFELCDKGTILLDEIAEMPVSLQAKLLHVLQDKEFSRLGGCRRIKVDVRVLAATNVKIEEAIASNQFRPDLYYRLSSFVFHVPPLRERREDIPLLISHYVRHFAAAYHLPAAPVPETLIRAAEEYDWPGNVRELENLVKRLLVVGDAGPLVRELESGRDGAPDGKGKDLKQLTGDLKDRLEIRELRRALEEAQWNRRMAAKRLGISYGALLYKIRMYDLKGSNGRSQGSESR